MLLIEATFKQFNYLSLYLFIYFLLTQEEMKHRKIFLFFLFFGFFNYLKGSPVVVSLSQNLETGSTSVQCNFTLVFTRADVDLEKSSVICDKDTKGKKAKVNIKTKEGYIFKGIVELPNKILKMTGGDYFEQYISEKIKEDSEYDGEPVCGGILEDISEERGYMNQKSPLWPNSEVTYSFVSDGSDLTTNEAAFYIDEKIGFNAEEIKVIVKSMKEIEADTCIKFQHVVPTLGKPWILIMRDGRKVPNECYVEYITENLVSKTIGDLGQPFSKYGREFCFRG